jgi:diacylglycerol kinase (ATP)
MGRVKVIVNPVAGRGRCAGLVPALHEQLTSHGLDYDLICTEAPGHAAVLADQALSQGFETIVAVGGDGTAHEVVNGMLTYSKGSNVGTMTAIPV